MSFLTPAQYLPTQSTIPLIIKLIKFGVFSLFQVTILLVLLISINYDIIKANIKKTTKNDIKLSTLVIIKASYMLIIFLYPVLFNAFANFIPSNTCIDGCWDYEYYISDLVLSISILVYLLFVLIGYKLTIKLFTNIDNKEKTEKTREILYIIAVLIAPIIIFLCLLLYFLIF